MKHAVQFSFSYFTVMVMEQAAKSNTCHTNPKRSANQEHATLNKKYNFGPIKH